MNILVIGGTLFVGRRLTQRLVADGHQVTLLHRKDHHEFGPSVTNLQCDRNDAAQLAMLLADRHFDLVFDNVYDWQHGTTGAQVAATARAVCGPRLQRYVFMSSVAAYLPGTCLHEASPLVPADWPDAYSRNKADSERALAALHAEIGLPYVALRPPFIFGPGNPYDREQWFWRRLAAGRRLLLPGDGEALMQFVFVEDLVAAMLLAATHPDAVGRSLNVADPRPISQRTFLAGLGAAAGLPVDCVPVSRARLAEAGGSLLGPQRRYFGEYLDLPPLPQHVAAVQHLGWRHTGFLRALRQTHAHWQTLPPQVDDFSWEDSLLAATINNNQAINDNQ